MEGVISLCIVFVRWVGGRVCAAPAQAGPRACAHDAGDNNATAARLPARPPTHILFYLFLILMSNINIIINYYNYITHILPMNVIIFA